MNSEFRMENGQYFLIAIILICITMMLMVLKLLVDRDGKGLAKENSQQGLPQVDSTLIFRNGGNASTWVEQMDLYFMVNAINHPASKAQLLLRHLDADVLRTIKASIKDSYGNYDFNKIVKTIVLMYGQKDMAAMRYRTIFNERKQGVDENIHAYLAAFNELASKAYPIGEILEETKQKYII